MPRRVKYLPAPRLADRAAVNMDMGLPVGLAIYLGHYVTVFGNLVTAVGAASGLQGPGRIGRGMSAPAMPATVDAHQVEFFTRKENRMHFCSPGKVFAAKRTVTAAGQYVGITGCGVGFTATTIVPAFPAPEQQSQC